MEWNKARKTERVSQCFLLFVFIVVFLGGRVLANEATLAENTAPASATDFDGAFQKAIDEIRKAEVLFPRLKNAFDETIPALSGGTVTFQPRLYYFKRDNIDGSRSEAFAGGGRLYVDTGWLYDLISFGGAYYRSDKIEGKEDEGGTGLLAPGQKSFDVLGEAYAALRYEGHELKLYRQLIDLPYLNKNDSRMVPYTFEAYRLTGRLEKKPLIGNVQYEAGYVDQIKLRNSDDFISMSEAAGVSDISRGLGFAGMLIQPTTNYSVGAINYYVEDVLNTFYTESNYSRQLTDEIDMRFDLQFTHQQSVGSDALTGSSFDTWGLGGRVVAGWKGLLLKGALSKIDDGEQLRNPYGSYPGYVSLMQSDFKFANEEAWHVGTSYDFGNIGLKGLSYFMNYTRGSNAQTAAGDDLPDRDEFNITADYKVSEGLLRNFWFRVRWSKLDASGVDDDSDELRVILNYELPLL